VTAEVPMLQGDMIDFRLDAGLKQLLRRARLTLLVAE